MTGASDFDLDETDDRFGDGVVMQVADAAVLCLKQAARRINGYAQSGEAHQVWRSWCGDCLSVWALVRHACSYGPKIGKIRQLPVVDAEFPRIVCDLF